MEKDFIKDVALTEKGGPRTMKVTIRPLKSQADYETCVLLEKEVWGQDFAECVPASMLMINQKVGGLSAGAFNENGRMVALIFGLTGVRNGKPTHWSHIMAVDEDFRNFGLGRQIKLYQREFLLGLSVETVRWTYDPLEAKNAHLNLNKLGAIPAEYALNVYGEGESSGLHSGIGTDRFIVDWHIREPQVARICREGLKMDTSEWLDVPVVNTDGLGRPKPEDFTLPRIQRVRVEVPADIQSVKNQDPELGKVWRRCTRRALEHYMTDLGFRARCFFRGPNTGRCYYALSAP
jgi:predicted GNAT superfamily acetyltransferase